DEVTRSEAVSFLFVVFELHGVQIGKIKFTPADIAVPQIRLRGPLVFLCIEHFPQAGVHVLAKTNVRPLRTHTPAPPVSSESAHRAPPPLPSARPAFPSVSAFSRQRLRHHLQLPQHLRTAPA